MQTTLESPHAPTSAPQSVATASPTRELVLLGAGYAHVEVLAQLAKKPLAGVHTTLITAQTRRLYGGMVSDFVAGYRSIDECAIALEPMVRAAGVRWLRYPMTAFDAHTQTVQLDDSQGEGGAGGSESGSGISLRYDWLSISIDPSLNRARVEEAIPGARAHGLFVRPLEMFAQLWPQVTAMASERGLRIAVIGAGSTGVELAIAVRQRLPHCAITLLCGNHPAAANYPAGAQLRIHKALRQHHITVIQEEVIAITASDVHLASGAMLACDVPIISTEAHAPAWLASSALALDAQGFVAVDAAQRSISHANVFAAPDVGTQQDPSAAHTTSSNTLRTTAPTMTPSLTDAMRSGPALFHNLSAATSGAPTRSHHPTRRPLQLIACGKRKAIATWGTYSAQGRWLRWLKNWMDHRYIARYVP